MNLDVSRTAKWGQLLLTTGSAQLAVQALALLSGVIVIRLLPTGEYAAYTVANALLATMLQISDSGIGSGVMSEGGKVWTNRSQLGTVLATGLRIRRRFATAVLLAALPLLVVLLDRQGVPLPIAAVIGLAMIPAYVAAVSATLLEIAVKLSQDLIPLQRIHIASNTARLAITSIALLALPLAPVALLAAGFAQIWATRRIRHFAAKFADLQAPADPGVESRISAIVRRVLPGTLYYCISTQISVWLISVFGTTRAVAEVGALGRLAIAINLVAVLFGLLVVPRFARLPESRRSVRVRYVQCNAALCVVAVAIVGAIALFPEAVLYVLGPEYASLVREAVIMSIGAVLSFLASSSYALNAARGHIVPPQLSIPYSLAFLAAALWMFPPTTAVAVLTVGAIVALAELILQHAYFARWSARITSA